MPADPVLYAATKRKAKTVFAEWPSARGSEWLVKTYKEHGGTFLGEEPKNEGLVLWKKQKWTDQHGKPCGESAVESGDIVKCRPTVRVSPATPVTWGEMSASEIKEALKEKRRVGMGARASAIRK